MSKRNECRTAIFYFDEGRVEFARTNERDATNQRLWTVYTFIGGSKAVTSKRRGRYVNRAEAKRILESILANIEKRKSKSS